MFTKNWERLLAGEVASRFLAHLVSLPAVRRLLSKDHFSVDGMLIEAWASIKSFRAVDEVPPSDGGVGGSGGGRNAARDFHVALWSNATQRSTTDVDCRLYHKGRGKEARLSDMSHALMENRNGLVVDGLANRATVSAACLAGEVMLMRRAGGDGRYGQGLRHRGLRRNLRSLPGSAARRPQYLGAAFQHRRHGGGERARSGELGPWEAHRGGLRVGQDRGVSLEDPASWLGAGWLAAHPGAGGLRSDPPAEAAGPRREHQKPAAQRALIMKAGPSARCGATPAVVGATTAKPMIELLRHGHRSQDAKHPSKPGTQKFFPQPVR